jgi:hypothetical protein
VRDSSLQRLACGIRPPRQELSCLPTSRFWTERRANRKLQLPNWPYVAPPGTDCGRDGTPHILGEMFAYKIVY